MTPKKGYALSWKAVLTINHYLEHGNQKAAYAYGYGRGRSKDKTFQNHVSRFFKRQDVDAEIRRRQREVVAASGITQERIVERLAEFAFANLPGIATFDGHVMTVRDFETLSPQQRAAIKEFEYFRDPPTKQKDEDGVERLVEGEAKVKLKLEGRVECCKLLGQHIGMWEKKKGAIVDAPLFNILIPAPAGPPAG